MSFWISILKFFDTEMTKPLPYGTYHIVSLIVIVLSTVALCVTHKYAKDPQKRVRDWVFWTAVAVFILEIYKQINYSFEYTDTTVAFDYKWYIFPWQFCSTPMYVGLLTGVFKKGKVHDALCAYLASFSIFAGIAVMVYPVTIFTRTAGINFQTTFCHGSMIVIGVYLLYSGHVKLEHRTILKALSVFAAAVAVAMVMNEIAYRSGLLETESFDMFYISPYCEPSLPVYSLVQRAVPYPWCLVLYIFGFTAAAYIILLAAMGIQRLAHRRPVPGKPVNV